MQTKRITVLGAGIIGVTAAACLRRDGHEVTLVDERPPGEYCSGGSAGILSPGSCVPLALPGVLRKIPRYLADPLGPLSLPLGYLPRALPWLLRFARSASEAQVERSADGLRALMRDTFRAYAPLVRNAGCEDLIRQTGYVAVYASEEARRGDGRAWKLRRDRGVVLRELGTDELRQMVPQLSGLFTCGMHLPEQGYIANPARLTKTLAGQFQRDGGTFLQRKVVDISVRNPGGTLVTDAGELPFENLVICAGAHSGRFAARLGDKVPLEAERGYQVTYSDPGVRLPMPVYVAQSKFFLTPMETGTRIAGQTEFAGIEAAEDWRRADVLKQHMKRILPSIDERGCIEWMGRRPSMPDSLPVIGRATRHANVFYNFGHGHFGMTCGAPSGGLVADLVAGRTPAIDPAPYGAGRFAGAMA
jgi:D-amino-acid dehydrogenase